MVVVGNHEEKDIVGMFSEKAYESARYFNYDDYDSAVDYAYGLIKCNFKEKMKETNFRFEVYKSMAELNRINNDLDSVELDAEVFASFIDYSEKICCDLDVRDNEWCLSFHRIIGEDEYEDLIDIEIEPNLESDTALMLQLKGCLEDFINQELKYQLKCKETPKI